MSYTPVPVAITGAGGLFFTAGTITDFPGGGVIEVAGANFVSNGAVKGDAITVTGSTSNNRDYILLEVVDEDNIVVYPAPNVEAGAGTCTVREQNHRLDIQDEATVSASAIEAALAEPRLFGLIASMPQRDGASFDIYSHIFRDFQWWMTSATESDWTISREGWILDWRRTGSSAVLTHGRIRVHPTSDSSTALNLTFGALADSGDPRSVTDGCLMAGTGPEVSSLGKIVCNAYGSMFMQSDHFGGGIAFGPGPGVGQVSGCIFDGRTTLGAIAGQPLDYARDLTMYSRGLTIISIPGVTDNGDILIGQMTQNIGFVATAAEVTLAGFELSDGVTASPGIVAFLAAVNVQDPREDYTGATLFTPNNGAVRKSYTWNPTFTDFNSVLGPSPIENLTVQVEKVADGHYLNILSQANGTYIITINGEAISHVSSGQSVSALRTSLIAAINGSSQPVTATATNNTQVASFSGIVINADVADTPFEIEITQDPSAGDLVLDPAVNGTQANQLGEDYREGEVDGSPFTTDSNGQLNGGAGINLTRFVGYETAGIARAINLQYKITVTGQHYRRTEFMVAPAAPFVGYLTIPFKKIGGFK